MVGNMGNEAGLPKDWRERIRGKKVILYNTSVSGMLSGGEAHIHKITQVLETFRKESRVALWWRPHPLELSTVEAMRPELAEKYKEIRTSYEEEGWGILDTSADVNRAIAVSDAYYGDWSSVVHLYKVTGKPILMAKDGAVECRAETTFAICDFVIVDNDMWFLSYNYNCLFRLNFSTFTVEEVILIPGERIYEQQVMQSIFKVDRKLFLLPCWGKNVIIYDMDKRTVIRKIPIGKHTTYPKYQKAYYKNGCLYMVASEKGKCMQIDTESLRIQSKCIQTQDIEMMEEDAKDIQTKYPTDKYIIVKAVGEKIYAFSFLENLWEIMDSKTGQSITKRINVTDTVKDELDNKQLFDICEDVEPLTVSPFYSGEDKGAYSLLRYMEAVINSKNSVSHESINLCGKKIYESV